MKALNKINSEDLFGLISRSFGHSIDIAWPTEMSGDTPLQAMRAPIEARRSIELSPLHQRHTIRRFVDEHPLAIDQIVDLVEIATSVVATNLLEIGEVRQSTNIDGDTILGLHLRLKMPHDEFVAARREIRQSYRENYPDGCQLVTPFLLRLSE